MIRKCPGCGTTSKKKFRVNIVRDDFEARCDCGYEHKLMEKNEKQRVENELGW